VHVTELTLIVGVIERKVAYASSHERAVICADVLGTALDIRDASRALRAARGRRCVDT